ncbi:MAG: 16S rRNA (guanine(527)-N(7))-methyltransferase RsmG [Candidatus Peribacteraceae bacterium]|nr:16S rRNA (guanine(527)-N(7))-methyltransferase RsmG [Candidatus Peribacteraceae bacterium]MDD5739374.1 16S rRNA (guanine(527)-N(7))-methyltransferase RsmG [Candidatus Peribacteraceae bacterium]
MIAEETQSRLKQLQEAFLAENAKLNLSAFRTSEACWTGNILDSLAALETEPLRALSPSPNPNPNPSPRILDLGTGGGFPLLPLAVCLPQCSFVGMDSVRKKVAAVQRIIDAVKIPNVSLVCGRSETLAREGAHREQYDVILVRALAELNVLLELAAPLVKVGGHILCWKSLKIEQELKDSLLARSELSCQMEKPYEYDLGGTWGRRQILLFRKRAKTNAKYPREVGEPKKNPLL